MTAARKPNFVVRLCGMEYVGYVPADTPPEKLIELAERVMAAFRGEL